MGSSRSRHAVCTVDIPDSVPAVQEIFMCETIMLLSHGGLFIKVTGWNFSQLR